MDRRPLLLALALTLAADSARAQSLPPTDVMMPGSQPPEIVAGFSLAQPPVVELLHSSTGPQACSGCHVASDPSGRDLEILHTWRGSMMANASRDPLTWAALAIAEQDFPGVGDTCIRCHVSKGWLGEATALSGRSVPSNGSALLASDADGVTCHLCHRLANPDGSEPMITGVQAEPFVAAGFACETGDAHEGVGCDPGTGEPCSGGAAACGEEPFVGNAMLAVFQNDASATSITRLGPYANPAAPHSAAPSAYQRDAALCGTCHDVSNPVTGDLAPGHGRQGEPLPEGAASGLAGAPVADKAAFRNPPYAYGVEQRTYSEWLASALAATRVAEADPATPTALPDELEVEGGVIRAVYEAAQAAGTGGDYADGTPRTFTCQSCHMRPVEAKGCTQQAAPVRSDLPLHDLTGANTWTPLAILYLDDATLHGTSRLRLGGGLDADQRQALQDGAARAGETLSSSVSLRLAEPASVLANTVRVVNLTGHKLFTGYPEGRRLWLRVRWRDAEGALVREDGAYGEIEVAEDVDGDGMAPDAVRTLLDPDDPHARVYHVESGITQAWAARLTDELGVAAATPLSFDRATGAVAMTLGQLADAAPDARAPSFHLALNDAILADNRIPPFGMDYAEARKRNALPVPETLYLPEGQAPVDGAVYEHADEVALDPPQGAARAEVALLYQTTSWEYVQFLWKANEGGDPFLASVGEDLLDAWLATEMAEPVVVAELALPEPAASLAAAAALAALAGIASRRPRARARTRGSRRACRRRA